MTFNLERLNFRITRVVLLTTAMVNLVFSYLFWRGLFYDLAPVCGSYCEIWPGIRVHEVCILLCYPRNRWYFPTFVIGITLLAFYLILRLLSAKTQTKHNNGEENAEIEPTNPL